MGVMGLNELIQGRHENWVKGLSPGEVLVVSTDRGIMEARQAVEMLMGGQLLCRVL